MVAAAIITCCSGPGQTWVFSVFVDPIIADTGVSRTTLSAMYLLGTGVSAALIVAIGRLVDRWGPRRMLFGIALLFAGACAGLSAATSAGSLLLGLAAVRAIGQGSLPVTATLLTAQWFVRYRGRAMSIVGLGIAVSTAAFPPLSRLLISTWGWRAAYLALGIGVGAIIVVLAAVIIRNSPESVGMHPDGLLSQPAGEQRLSTPTLRRAAVFSSRRFWLLALPLASSPIVVTALTFHQAAIFGERGLGPDVAASVFPVFALLSAIATGLAGFAVDRWGPQRLLTSALSLQIVALAQLPLIATPLAAAVYAGTLGSAVGLQSTVGGVLWAHEYGRQGLGRVQGAAGMIQIAGSAVGPLLLATITQRSATHTLGIFILATIPLACLALLSQRRQPRASQPV